MAELGNGFLSSSSCSTAVPWQVGQTGDVAAGMREVSNQMALTGSSLPIITMGIVVAFWSPGPL